MKSNIENIEDNYSALLKWTVTLGWENTKTGLPISSISESGYTTNYVILIGHITQTSQVLFGQEIRECDPVPNFVMFWSTPAAIIDLG